MYVSNDEPMARYIEVWLDGALVDVCTEAHEEEGWIRVYVLDEAGRFCLCPDLPHICTALRHGEVRLRLRALAPLWAVEQFAQRRASQSAAAQPDTPYVDPCA